MMTEGHNEDANITTSDKDLNMNMLGTPRTRRSYEDFVLIDSESPVSSEKEFDDKLMSPAPEVLELQVPLTSPVKFSLQGISDEWEKPNVPGSPSSVGGSVSSDLEALTVEDKDNVAHTAADRFSQSVFLTGGDTTLEIFESQIPKEENDLKIALERFKTEREELIKRNKELQETIEKLSAQHNWAIENVVNSSDVEREAFARKLRELTEERDTLAAELKHSEGQFAVLVGEILDQKLETIHSMVSAAVSPPASPDRKGVDTVAMASKKRCVSPSPCRSTATQTSEDLGFGPFIKQIIGKGRQVFRAARRGLGIAARASKRGLDVAMVHAGRGARIAGHHSRNGLEIVRVHGGRSATAVRNAGVRLWNKICAADAATISMIEDVFILGCCLLGVALALKLGRREPCQIPRRSHKKRPRRAGASRSWTADSGEPPADYLKRILEAVRSEKTAGLPPPQVQSCKEVNRDAPAAQKIELATQQPPSDADNAVEVEVIRNSTRAPQLGWNKALQNHASHAFEELMVLEQHSLALLREFSHGIEEKVSAHWSRPRGLRFLSEQKKEE
eukprot:jgi/Botrbrau1/20218/Bobra.31_1s0015.1